MQEFVTYPPTCTKPVNQKLVPAKLKRSIMKISEDFILVMFMLFSDGNQPSRGWFHVINHNIQEVKIWEQYKVRSS